MSATPVVDGWFTTGRWLVLRIRVGPHGAAPRELDRRVLLAVARRRASSPRPGDVDVAEVYDLSTALELDWQLRGQAEGRQVQGARVEITANQGLFGHGSAVVLAV